jgi:hypothetical protein
MPGGLMQLLTTGAQDQYLTVSPEMSYFKQVYKHPTNFSMQSVQTPFSSVPFINTGSRTLYTCKIPRVGDLFKDVFLSIALPDIYVPAPTDTANKGLQIVNGIPTGIPQFRWIPNVGNYMIYSYSLTADTQLLDQRWGEFNDVTVELSQPLNKKATYDRMTANDASFLNPSVSQSKVILNNNRITYAEYPYSTNTTNYEPSIKSRRLYVPLDFWFSKSPDLAIPLVALQYQVVTINIEFRALEEIFQVYDPVQKMYISPAAYRSLYQTTLSISDYLQLGGSSQNTIDLNAYLECNYVFLDTPERTFIATNSFDCLVERVYRSETSGINNIYNIDLSIANPVKEMIWITRRSDISTYNDWTNLTASIPANENYPALATAKIVWNGIDRFDEKDSRYFNLLQPYNYHTSSPREGIYCYSFALYPEKVEPSGTFNASTINKVQLYLTMNSFPEPTIKYPTVAGSSSTEYTVIVYTVYYNIFRVMSGSGAMVFAN